MSASHFTQCPNVSKLPLRQCLSLSVVQLKGKHCRKPHCRNGVVDMFRQFTMHLSVTAFIEYLWLVKQAYKK